MRVQPEAFVSMNSTPVELTSVSIAHSFSLEGHFPEPVPNHRINLSRPVRSIPSRGSLRDTHSA